MVFRASERGRSGSVLRLALGLFLAYAATTTGEGTVGPALEKSGAGLFTPPSAVGHAQGEAKFVGTLSSIYTADDLAMPHTSTHTASLPSGLTSIIDSNDVAAGAVDHLEQCKAYFPPLTEHSFQGATVGTHLDPELSAHHSLEISQAHTMGAEKIAQRFVSQQFVQPEGADDQKSVRVGVGGPKIKLSATGTSATRTEPLPSADSARVQASSSGGASSDAVQLKFDPDHHTFMLLLNGDALSYDSSIFHLLDYNDSTNHTFSTLARSFGSQFNRSSDLMSLVWMYLSLGLSLWALWVIFLLMLIFFVTRVAGDQACVIQHQLSLLGEIRRRRTGWRWRKGPLVHRPDVTRVLCQPVARTYYVHPPMGLPLVNAHNAKLNANHSRACKGSKRSPAVRSNASASSGYSPPSRSTPARKGKRSPHATWQDAARARAAHSDEAAGRTVSRADDDSTESLNSPDVAPMAPRAKRSPAVAAAGATGRALMFTVMPFLFLTSLVQNTEAVRFDDDLSDAEYDTWSTYGRLFGFRDEEDYASLTMMVTIALAMLGRVAHHLGWQIDDVLTRILIILDARYAILLREGIYHLPAEGDDAEDPDPERGFESEPASEAEPLVEEGTDIPPVSGETTGDQGSSGADTDLNMATTDTTPAPSMDFAEALLNYLQSHQASQHDSQEQGSGGDTSEQQRLNLPDMNSDDGSDSSGFDPPELEPVIHAPGQARPWMAGRFVPRQLFIVCFLCVFVEGAAAVTCHTCFDQIVGCTGGANCLLHTRPQANTLLVAGAAGAISLASILPVKFLRECKSSALACLKMVANRPTLGAPIDITTAAMPNIDQLITAVQSGAALPGDAMRECLSRLALAPNQLEANRLNGLSNMLSHMDKAASAISASTKTVVLGSFSLAWSLAGKVVRQSLSTGVSGVSSGDGPSEAATPVVQMITLSVTRPRTMAEFSDMITCWHMICHATGLCNILALGEFTRDVIHDSISRHGQP